MLRETVARLAQDRFAPNAREWEAAGTPLPAPERKLLGSLGFLGVAIDETYGGSSVPLVHALGVIEEVAKVSQIAAWPIFEANCGAARVIELFGSEAQKEVFLPAICSGDRMMAVAISEPEAGSAATDLTTLAPRRGGAYQVSGTKRWCSGAGHADDYLVYVRMEATRGARGIGAVVIPRDAGGLSFGPTERLMGFRGIPSAEMYLDDVVVEAENVIVPAGRFGDLFTAFSIERLGNATMSLAIGQACLDRTARHVQERIQFGKPIIDFQLVQAAVADMIIEVAAARHLIESAAATAGCGAPTAIDSSIAKCYANEMAKRVSDQAIELHGGYGYSVEYEIERFHRDAIGWSIGGGTPNIQRIRIVSEYLGRRFDQRA